VEHEFDVDTQVARVADNEYAATLTDRWNALGGRPNGGYALATCVRALRDVIPGLDPLAVSAFFLRPAVPGAATIRTELVRSGRRIATGEVKLFQDDKEVVRAVASFADLAQAAGPTTHFEPPPALPPVEETIDLTGGASLPEITIINRFEYRVTALPGWVQGKPSGDPRMALWLRFRDGREPDPLALVAMVDAVWPAVMELGAMGSATIELSVHVRAKPTPGWLACRVATRYVSGGYHEEDFEIWDSDGKLVAQSRQLALFPQG
jgi:acyl-CoA thioesterase